MTALRTWSAPTVALVAPTLALAAQGCSAAASEAAVPEPVALVSIAPSTPASTTAERDWPPKRLRLPETACVVRGETRAGVRSLDLRKAPGGKVFARIVPNETRTSELALPPGEPGDAVLTVGNGHAFVAGFVSANEVRVRMRQAEMLGGFVVPKYNAELDWTRAEAGALHLKYRLNEGFAGAHLLDLEVSCKSITLDRGFYDAMDALSTPPTMEPARLRPGAHALYRDRFGHTKLDLQIRNTPRVWLLEETPDRLRIAWERQSEVLVGWVAVAALDRAPAVARARRSRSNRVVPVLAGEQGEGIRCKHSLPLVVGDGDDLLTVGSVPAGVKLALGRAQRELTEIRIDELPVKLSPGETLWGRRSELDACGPPSDAAKP